MKVYGNQKVVLVKKAPANKQNLYSVINIEAAHAAMRNLQEVKAGFMLWYYLAENQNNYMFALSSADFMKETGCKIKAYTAAVNALEEKGYLVKQDKNLYIFYESGLMLSKDKEDKKYNDTLKSNTIPLKSQATCAPKGDYLSFESTRNNTNNTINNTNILLGEKEEDMKKTITLAELQEQEALGREFQVHSKEGYVEFFDNDEVMYIAPDVAAYYHC